MLPLHLPRTLTLPSSTLDDSSDENSRLGSTVPSFHSLQIDTAPYSDNSGDSSEAIHPLEIVTGSSNLPPNNTNFFAATSSDELPQNTYRDVPFRQAHEAFQSSYHPDPESAPLSQSSPFSQEYPISYGPTPPPYTFPPMAQQNVGTGMNQATLHCEEATGLRGLGLSDSVPRGTARGVPTSVSVKPGVSTVQPVRQPLNRSIPHGSAIAPTSASLGTTASPKRALSSNASRTCIDPRLLSLDSISPSIDHQPSRGSGFTNDFRQVLPQPILGARRVQLSSTSAIDISQTTSSSSASNRKPNSRQPFRIS